MKLKLTAVAMALSLFLIGCGGEPEVNSQEGTQVKEVLSEGQKLVNSFKDYSEMTIKAKNKELQTLIEESIVEYEKLVDLIYEEMNKAKLETKKEYIANIEELKVILVEEKVSYEADCKEIKASNQDLCNHKGAQVNKLENKIKSVEVGLSNELKSLDNKMENTLKSYQAKLKTNISKLLSQDD